MRVRLFLCREEEEDEHPAQASVGTSKQKGKSKRQPWSIIVEKHLPVL
jgi:hypothetical protein